MDNDKPTGTYQCAGCQTIWDSRETYIDPQSLRAQLTCGNLQCGASVRRISELPKVDYMKSLETKVR